MNGLLEGRGRQVREAEERARESQARCDDIANKYRALQGEYQKQSEALLEVAEERSVLMHKTTAAGAKSKDKGTPCDFNMVMDQLRVLQKQMTRVLAECAEIKAQNSAIKAQNAEIKAQNAEMKAQTIRIRAESTRFATEAAALKDEVLSLKKRLHCLLTPAIVEVLKQGDNSHPEESSAAKWVYKTTVDSDKERCVADLWLLPDGLLPDIIASEGFMQPSFTVAELMRERDLVDDSERAVHILYTLQGKRPVYLTGATCSTCLFDSQWTGERYACAMLLPRAKEQAKKQCPRYSWMINYEWWTVTRYVECRGHWLLGSEYSNYYLKVADRGVAMIEMVEEGRKLAFEDNPEFFFDLVRVEGDRVLLQSAKDKSFLSLFSGYSSEDYFLVTAGSNRDEATQWYMRDYLSWLPKDREVHIVTSRGTFLQANKNGYIKHFGKTQGSDPLTKWIIQYGPQGYECFKNVGTGKYLAATGQEHVRAVRDKCEEENGGLWVIRWSLVDDERGVAWNVWSVTRGAFLSAHGDDENWVTVDRKEDKGWEHFTIQEV
eukprot:m51a1_g10745 hypothetical protein (548) ;mRNA; f:338737-341671